MRYSPVSHKSKTNNSILLLVGKWFIKLWVILLNIIINKIVNCNNILEIKFKFIISLIKINQFNYFYYFSQIKYFFFHTRWIEYLFMKKLLINRLNNFLIDQNKLFVFNLS